MDIPSKFQAWRPAVLGAALQLDDSPGTPSMDVVFSWAHTCFPTVPYQSIFPPVAIPRDLFEIADPTYFGHIGFIAGTLPEQGDIAVLNSFKGDAAGLVGVVNNANAGGMWLLYQSEDTDDDVTHEEYLLWHEIDCLGWLRPRKTAPEILVPPPHTPTPPPPVEPQTYTQATDTHGIKYQALQVHRRMYVNKNPANKYHFDQIETHMDAPRKVVEKVAYGTPVYVVMEATHPIPPTGAVYYMDAEAVGDFKHTGHVSAAIGFNKSDLSDGTAPGKPEPKPEVVKPQLVNNVIDATVAKLPGRTSTSAAKASLDTSYAGVYELLQNIPIREIDGQRDPVEPGQGARMHILGFFTYDGQTYGKPDVGEKLNKHGWWYMVPIAALTQVEKEAHYQERIAEKLAQEDAIMDEPITVADKAPRSLTKKEHLLLVLGTIIASWHNHQTKKLKKIGDK